MVAPGVVIPFGVYNAHISAKTSAGLSIKDEIRETALEADRVRASGASPAAVRAFLRPRLARIRKAIRELTLEPWFVDELLSAMRGVFGADGSYGVFVRSDTNAEDLPGFTGAGLNLTLPNLMGTQKILQGIKDVWASPFEERAYEWRAQALVSTIDVYPSIILLKSVPCDKSGVLATANLETLDTSELTVNVNEGVAAVVDGGIAESLLLEPDGGIRLLAQAQSPYRKTISPAGGLAEVPTSGLDLVLTLQEIAQLRQLARDVKEKFPPERDSSGEVLPWDIEFGFVEAQLRLFQIRPLSRFRETAILEALAAFEPNAAARTTIRLGEPTEWK
jgi:phosphoenolpyruvate synthase/pyruvate phosphate dikinase